MAQAAKKDAGKVGQQAATIKEIPGIVTFDGLKIPKGVDEATKEILSQSSSTFGKWKDLAFRLIPIVWEMKPVIEAKGNKPAYYKGEVARSDAQYSKLHEYLKTRHPSWVEAPNPGDPQGDQARFQRDRASRETSIVAGNMLKYWNQAQTKGGGEDSDTADGAKSRKGKTATFDTWVKGEIARLEKRAVSPKASEAESEKCRYTVGVLQYMQQHGPEKTLATLQHVKEGEKPAMPTIAAPRTVGADGKKSGPVKVIKAKDLKDDEKEAMAKTATK
jgi:hypothetical protein